RSGWFAHHAVEAPTLRHPLEIVFPLILEPESAAGDQIPDRRRDQDLVRSGHRRHARSDVDRDTSHVASRDLDLTRVHAGPDLETQRPNLVDRGLRAPDRPRRAVEDREEPVSRCVYLAAAVLRELGANDRLVRREEL